MEGSTLLALPCLVLLTLLLSPPIAPTRAIFLVSRHACRERQRIPLITQLGPKAATGGVRVRVRVGVRVRGFGV